MAVNCADPCAWTASAACVACCSAYFTYIGLYGRTGSILARLCFAVIGLVWFGLLNALLSLHWHLIVACLVLRSLARVIVFLLEASAVILVVRWSIGYML